MQFPAVILNYPFFLLTRERTRKSCQAVKRAVAAPAFCIGTLSAVDFCIFVKGTQFNVDLLYYLLGHRISSTNTLFYSQFLSYRSSLDHSRQEVLHENHLCRNRGNPSHLLFFTPYRKSASPPEPTALGSIFRSSILRMWYRTRFFCGRFYGRNRYRSSHRQ